MLYEHENQKLNPRKRKRLKDKISPRKGGGSLGPRPPPEKHGDFNRKPEVKIEKKIKKNFEYVRPNSRIKDRKFSEF